MPLLVGRLISSSLVDLGVAVLASKARDGLGVLLVMSVRVLNTLGFIKNFQDTSFSGACGLLFHVASEGCAV